MKNRFTITPEKREELREKRKKSAEEYLEKLEKKNKTSQEDIQELQRRLVDTCIKFINEKNIGDLERVEFNADSLIYSSEMGIWTPATDSYIECSKIEFDQDFFGIIKKIGSFC